MCMIVLQICSIQWLKNINGFTVISSFPIKITHLVNLLFITDLAGVGGKVGGTCLKVFICIVYGYSRLYCNYLISVHTPSSGGGDGGGPPGRAGNWMETEDGVRIHNGENVSIFYNY